MLITRYAINRRFNLITIVVIIITTCIIITEKIKILISCRFSRIISTLIGSSVLGIVVTIQI